MKQPKIILDMDGTLIDSTQAIAKCQLKTLQEMGVETPKTYSTSQLNRILSQNNIEKDEFFKTYKTFNVEAERAAGNVYAYDDVMPFLEQYKDTQKAIISNSSQKATDEKARLFNLDNQVDMVLAEYVTEKAKPQPYMGEKALEGMQASKDDFILNIGDAERDMEFGHNLKQAGYQNTVNILLDRQNQNPTSQYADHTINSLNEIGDLIERYQ